MSDIYINFSPLDRSLSLLHSSQGPNTSLSYWDSAQVENIRESLAFLSPKCFSRIGRRICIVENHSTLWNNFLKNIMCPLVKCFTWRTFEDCLVWMLKGIWIKIKGQTSWPWSYGWNIIRTPRSYHKLSVHAGEECVNRLFCKNSGYVFNQIQETTSPCASRTSGKQRKMDKHVEYSHCILDSLANQVQMLTREVISCVCNPQPFLFISKPVI